VRILGIDPGLRTTGWGVIDTSGSNHQALSYVASGTISTVSLETKNLPIRLKMLFDGVQSICKTYAPDVSAIEIVFVNVNPQSTLLLGQARGACITGLVSCDVAVAEYTALQLKQAVVGYGRAAKHQVQEMVMRLLKLPGLPGPDAADALGMAITHAHSSHRASSHGAPL
jgi:crossover junction endodeoxyribonuclease RuvC